jgi:hypothetical protein
LEFFNSASSLKQQFADRHVDPLGDITLILSQPVFDFALMLHKNNKYQFYSLWYDHQGLNPRSTAFKASMLTITPLMHFYIYKRRPELIFIIFILQFNIELLSQNIQHL